jgi:hypothetical protein
MGGNRGFQQASMYAVIAVRPQFQRPLTELFSSMKTVRLEIHEVTHWTLGETVFAVGTAMYEFEAPDGSRSTPKRMLDRCAAESGRQIGLRSRPRHRNPVITDA